MYVCIDFHLTTTRGLLIAHSYSSELGWSAATTTATTTTTTITITTTRKSTDY